MENGEGKQEPAEPQQVPERQSLYKGPRGTAVKILNRIERSDSYLDRLVDAELRGTEMNELDKGLMNQIVTGVIRWQMKLDWVLTGFFHGNFTKAETNIRNVLRVALYQILFLDKVPQSAAVNEAVEFTKRVRSQKAADLVNAILRNIIRNIDNIRYPDPAQDNIQTLAVIESHPYWMVKRWVNRFGYENAEKFLKANNQIPDLTLRVNRTKIDFTYFLNQLDQHQIEFSKSRYLDFFVRVKHMAGIGRSEMFQQGFFIVQDESAGMAVQLLSPQSGDRVIDMCAAPGGKTTMIGELMKNVGEIIAVDRYETRLNLVKNACQRLGIANTHYIAADAATVQTTPADKVLVDAPCSGLGVLSKKPDAKWQREPEDLDKLVKIQRSILENAASHVKPGGVLVYSTCTTEPEENFGVVSSFLAAHPEFSIDNAKKFINEEVVTQEGFVETFPHIHSMDGSFAIRLVKSR
ncbi:MAG: 16S rRNA (cytosine(967)-C(5))-methyltransferase RsmB [bacterium]